MNSSYKNDDVIFLLKDVTGLVEPLPSIEREKLIQSGMHYSEMLPIEYIPTEEYMEIYFDSFKIFGQSMANALASLADKIVKKRDSIVLVSLARAGTPIGILLKRYIKWKYNISLPHYSVSIIRDRGIDDNAMKYILAHHKSEEVLFVDGWIGKGAILKELKLACKNYKGVSPELAVVSDPAGETELAGTYDDIFIPSSALNATVCGLVSRTFLRDDIIGKDDYHGAIYYREYEKNDLSYHFINNIEKLFRKDAKPVSFIGQRGIIEVEKQAKRYGIKDINLIKPGIGETTRVLLRRVPWKVLVDERYKDDRELKHILKLAAEKESEIEYTRLNNYKCMGIIKKMKDI
jgi:hypothetical protein